MTLCELAQQHGTDKLRHGYTPLYDELFTPLRDRPVNVVELGVLRGASIRMWADYFTHGTIYGVDIRPAFLEALRGIERVVPVLAYSESPNLCENLPERVDEKIRGIDERIRALQGYRARLDSVLSACSRGGCVATAGLPSCLCSSDPGEGSPPVEGFLPVRMTA